MTNYILSYDLNGSVPTHRQMDERIRSTCFQYGRILETVWYIRSAWTLEQMYQHINAILSPNDRVAIVEAEDMCFRNLLVSVASLQGAWSQAA
jgi:hypothetical protein